MTEEAREEARLARDARERRLGVLRHPDLPAGELEPESWDSAVVDVLIRRVDEGPLEAGHYDVLMPSYPPEGLSENDALAKHPATLAHDTVYDHVAAKGYEWFEISDVRSS